ncbi:DNA replication protein DnaD [Clostridium pascui]|uniref:DnaD domain protein n=1 Tax=Clostridium pascui TaxID=46609 RepID=UPI00195EA6B6|nr:DnaD domain protein [Clostridium pascui]MBM7869442.1 DNA replication protein DnaD [Clostridium pascui]
MKYIDSVLNNWYSLGLTTGLKVQAYQMEWKYKSKDECSEIKFEGANAEAYVYVD